MIVDCAVYEEGRRRDGPVELNHAYEACRQSDTFAWIGLYEPSEEEFDSLKREFVLHPLAVEDAINAHQRPKLDVYENLVFIVLKTARYVDEREVVEFGEILIFLGHDYLLTVRHGKASALQEVRTELEHNPELLKRGPGAVLHAIVDRVVDDYAPALAGLGEDIEEVENEVFSDSRTNPAERIYKLKREVLDFNRAAAPLVEPVDRLAKGHYDQVHPEVRAYFGDVNDHLVRVHEQLESYRDLLTSILEANLAQITRAPEPGRAHDLGHRGDRRGADDDRRHLRDELRAHAGARLDLRLSAGPRAHGQHLLRGLQVLQEGGLAAINCGHARRLHLLQGRGR